MTAKKRIEAIVDTLHEPIVGLGPDSRILFMNREAFSVLNLREDAVGRDDLKLAKKLSLFLPIKIRSDPRSSTCLHVEEHSLRAKCFSPRTRRGEKQSK